MSITIAGITVSQGATILNAIISFVQYTLGLSLLALLVNIISNVHSAITWSVIGRELHTSLWPTLLGTDSSHSAARRVVWLSRLRTFSSILAAVSGVITPLGIKLGPLVATQNARHMNAVYVGDTSPLASATSPRSSYFYSRPCNFLSFGPCPGGIDGAETVEINPSIVEQFNSTPHGPFTMQFRRYYSRTLLHHNYTSFSKDVKHVSVIEAQFTTLESLILRDGIFAVEGAIVDMSGTPGIGLTNHTMPASLKYGGTWSQDMLWLEPATSCVDTNLTIDYKSPGSVDALYYLTDRGGFVNLGTQFPQVDRSGQNTDLYQRAYAGAFQSNIFNMIMLNNITRNQSTIGKVFGPFGYAGDATINPTRVVQFVPLEYLRSLFYDVKADTNADRICSGYSGEDIADITNVGVNCGTFLGPPYRRTDGGYDQLWDVGSTQWTQNLYVCASTTKASIQRVSYSLKGEKDLANLQITRSLVNKPVVWATEKTNMLIRDVAIYWGQVTDSFEFNPTLTTNRASEFYIPASYADMDGKPVPGQPHTIPGAAWHTLYYGMNDMHPNTSLVDYSGSTSAALLKKYQSIIASNLTRGVAHICNLIWTDIVANTLVGTDTSTVLSVAEYHPSIKYDLKYAIPLILLIIIWLPFFAITSVFLASGALKFSEIKNLLNHTSVGRIVTGYSALTVQKAGTDESDISQIPLDSNEEDWAATAGRTLLSYKPNARADEPKEEIELLSVHEGDSSYERRIFESEDN